MINVVIADNQILTQEGLVSILSTVDDIVNAGKASNITTLLKLVKDLKPDVILMDNDFSDGTLVYPHLEDSRVLLLSNKESRDHILELINKGARNLVFKRCSRDEIIQAIYATAKGERFYCEQTLQTIRGRDAVNPFHGIEPNLSYREVEIVQLIADGMTNKDIAAKLFLSVHTIKTHRKNIIKKLGFTFKHASELILILSYLNDIFI
ncbi:response regulator transcription factor [Pedobacter psychrodurus]|uniref:response regulator transcription factor n=1 Tax=Pedobacter psychrodurus TaxID=2530456 RepID=UPI002931068E|nr:response regulator transcription factor [Pedobacter psychrodurus]